ncbi:MAG TPA: hypothetical protein VM888_10210, partial [Chitinophagaceae bacterium]|nr:hypothetical protein [Chitinophagaceae bacterium]
YIQAVYHIKQREDSVAKNVLSTLIQQNGGTPLAQKADNLLKVLSRRAEIENELANLQLVMPEEERKSEEVTPITTLPVTKPLATTKTTTPPTMTAKDTSVVKAVSPITIAMDSAVKKDVAEVKKDTIAAIKPLDIVKKPTPKPTVDTAVKKPVINKPTSPFTFKPDAPHYAVIILNKVDVVFVGEAKNAYFRYNREKYANQPLAVNIQPFNDSTNFVLIGNFPSAQSAADYVLKTKPLSPTEIVPWLKGDKYTFTILSKENLDVLLNLKDMKQYAKFLEQNLPVKF